MVTAAQNRAALNTLLAKADPRRVARAKDRPMLRTEWTGSRWEGECEGANGSTHKCLITLEGQRSFNCTCSDKRDRAHEVGPCKHVISLAQVALEAMWVVEILEGGSIPFTTA
jgi:hypothetical protein